MPERSTLKSYPLKQERCDSNLTTGFIILKIEQHQRSIRLSSSLPGRIAQWPPITKARPFKQATWSAHQIQKGDSSVHGGWRKHVLPSQGKEGESEFPLLLLLARWRPNSRTSRVPRNVASLQSWFITKMFITKTNFHFGDALKSVPTEKRCHGTRASC